jgi:hypothetical protein
LENILRISRREEEREKERMDRERNELVNQVRRAFELMDTDGDDQLSIDEFQTAVKDPDVLLCLSRVGMPVSEAEELFLFMDVEEKGSITVDDFIEGCARTQGMAKSKHLLRLHYDVQKVWANLKTIVESLPDKVAEKAADSALRAAALKGDRSAQVAIDKRSLTSLLEHRTTDSKEPRTGSTERIRSEVSSRSESTESIMSGPLSNTAEPASGNFSQPTSPVNIASPSESGSHILNQKQSGRRGSRLFVEPAAGAGALKRPLTPIGPRLQPSHDADAATSRSHSATATESKSNVAAAADSAVVQALSNRITRVEEMLLRQGDQLDELVQLCKIDKGHRNRGSSENDEVEELVR